MSRESYVTEQDGSPGPCSQPLGWVAGDKAVFAGRVGVGGVWYGEGSKALGRLQLVNLLASNEPFHAPPTPISASSL